MIKNLDKLQRKLTKLKDIETKKVIEKASGYVRDEARKLVPVDEGQLKQSISYKVVSENKKHTGIVFTNLEYAPYVEFGTGPKGQENHKGISPEITPKYSLKGWSYFDDKTGKFIYTKGQKAQPFLYPALHKNRKKIKEFIKAETKKEISKLKGG